MSRTQGPPGTPGLLRAMNDRTALALLIDRGPLTIETGLAMRAPAAHLLHVCAPPVLGASLLVLDRLDATAVAHRAATAALTPPETQPAPARTSWSRAGSRRRR